jgi:hypothetical protein
MVYGSKSDEPFRGRCYSKVKSTLTCLTCYRLQVVVSVAEFNAKAASLPVLHAVDVGLQVRSSLASIYTLHIIIVVYLYIS